MSSAELLGREDELTAVERLVSPAREGPGMLMLEGAAGIGKTAIWQSGIRAAREHGLRVLPCRPSPTEMPLAFSALSDLLGTVADAFLPKLPPPQRAALEISLLLRDVAEAPPDQRAVSLATLTLLRTAAQETPLLLAIDDVQWLDSSSARVLAFVLRRIENDRCRVLMTRRIENGDGTLPADLDLGARSPETFETRTVGPLSFGAIRAVIRTRLSAHLPRKLLNSICEASGGNPFYAMELARAQLERSEIGPGQPLQVPESLSGLIRRRLAELPSPARDALLICATLSHPTLASLGDDAAALGDAIDAGIVEIDNERVQFTHPLRASVVYAEASEAERRNAHARAAGLTKNSEERARHLALASTDPDESVAQELEKAAKAASARAAPAAAAELSELASKLTPRGDRKALARRQMATAEHLFATGEIERCRALLESLAEDLGPCPERADALVLLSETVADLDEAIRLCRQAVDEARGDDARIASAAIVLGAAYARENRNAEQIEAARLALEHAEKAGDERLLIESLQGVANASVLLGDPVDESLMQRALDLEAQIGGLTGRHSPRLWKAAQLAWIDELDAARPIMEAETQRTLDEGQLTEWLHLIGMRIVLEMRAGNYELAERLVEEALREESDVGISYLALGLGALQQSIRSLRGDVEARAGLNEVLGKAKKLANVQAASQALIHLTLLELCEGDAAQAWHWISELAGQGREGEGHKQAIQPRYVLSRVLAVETLLALGEEKRAEEICLELARMAEKTRQPLTLAMVARSRALLEVSRGDFDAAVDAFSAALKHHASAPVPFERARTEFLFGISLRRAKRRREAGEMLSRALQHFERIGAAEWATRARSELARAGVGQRSRGNELSPTERQVAELVATGQTNREVAAALFMSVRTVEANLSKIYRKLGIESRSELAGRLASENAEEA